MEPTLIARKKYLNDALRFRDTDMVKVVTGVRRCGKSSLLQLVRKQIEAEGVPGRGFIDVNLERRGLGIRTDDDLYAYLVAHMSDSGRTYVFLDEVQRISGWHDVVNSIRVEYDCDIYVTGSNAYLLSGQIATYLSGRYVEIAMLPLSFAEYALFCGLDFGANGSAALLGDGSVVTFDDIFRKYMEFGGMPAIASLNVNQAMHAQYMEGVYSTVVVRDVLNRERNGRWKVADADLLRLTCEYLADTVGRQSSVTKMAGALIAGGRKTTATAVSAYIQALEDAFIVYSCRRYDIHGRALLKTMPKYYLVDTGMRQYLSGYRSSDVGFVFENAVYLQLLYEGWAVHVGKLYRSEVDFVAVKDGRTVYIQVTDEMFDEQTRLRELRPLRDIGDSFEKIVVVRQGDPAGTDDGIQIVRAKDFFLKAAW